MTDIILKEMNSIYLDLEILLKEHFTSPITKIKNIKLRQGKWVGLCNILVDIDKPIAIERQTKVKALFNKAEIEIEKQTKLYKQSILKEYAEQIKAHYPHTISIRNTVDKELKKIMEE